MQDTIQHIPVLLREVVEYLSPEKGDRYLDLTAGYGGHAQAIIDKTKSFAVLVDRDTNAHDTLKLKFDHCTYVSRVKDNFESASRKLVRDKMKFDIILVDLGISSPHIDNKERGFSLRYDGPLDMRMDQAQSLTAEIIVNTYSKDRLISILHEYGEEPKAERIAQNIIDARPVKTTAQLALIAKKAWPGHSKIHPATRTFQAIRIAVNDELGQIERSLPLWVDLLSDNGKLGIITFHSLEDRIVKHFLKENLGNRYDAKLEATTKKPIVASRNEIVYNPRARSAKLRIVARKRK